MSSTRRLPYWNWWHAGGDPCLPAALLRCGHPRALVLPPPTTATGNQLFLSIDSWLRTTRQPLDRLVMRFDSRGQGGALDGADLARLVTSLLPGATLQQLQYFEARRRYRLFACLPSTKCLAVLGGQ